jgi:S-formylglutathione hydrolase FrmB
LQRCRGVRITIAAILWLSLTGCTGDESAGELPDGGIDEPDAGVVAPDPATFTSGDGITVTAVTQVSERTVDVLVSTPAIAEAATSRGNGVRITLPPDYATSGKRYPVIYDLHGAGGGSYVDSWAGGTLEKIASGANADVIIVMPDGGKNGWYTDWIDQSVAQKWETYHLTQLVPFIDRNLRTLGTRAGRGIVGLSMGGFGAMRYAVDRPDLFAVVTSLSGAIDLDQVTVQSAVILPSILFGLPPFGAFGGYGFTSPSWGAVNPVRRASRLATVATFLYIGAGTDPAELIVLAATESMHRALETAGVAHDYTNYGVPGANPYGFCGGGHTFECSLFALGEALPRMLAVLADAT